MHLILFIFVKIKILLFYSAWCYASVINVRKKMPRDCIFPHRQKDITKRQHSFTPLALSFVVKQVGDFTGLCVVSSHKPQPTSALVGVASLPFRATLGYRSVVLEAPEHIQGMLDYPLFFCTAF